ncbi:hypothetical protein SAMN04488564_11741 [Lentzea waywayandensis]|uniref:Uncharacterized protein n=1 Tax=Lentzea waywayandensis TaxID=84724 RepID=A0A1I6FH65_9PSEU|nr:hypothetical protein [Lentzea waywayandensis]SFR29117.1 hypothetical protein SAMN04488564_11741 [Lentzea waywayandensis]
MRVVIVAVAVAALDAAALLVGWWWVTALVAALVVYRFAGKRVLLAVLAGTAVAWGASMVAQAGTRMSAVGDLVAAMALNTRGLGWAVVGVSLVYALLLALAGSWVGGVVRRLRRSEPEAIAEQDESVEAVEAQHV